MTTITPAGMAGATYFGTPVPYVGAITAAHQLSWHRAIAEYRRRLALLTACEGFGPSAVFDREYEEKKAMTSDRTARLSLAREYEAYCDTHFLEFIEPCDLAAVMVVLTPAPTLDAAIEKVDIIIARELDNYTGMPGDPFAFVKADMDRFAPAGGEA